MGMQQPNTQQGAYLLHDPWPGTLYVFPSFVPHFVFPVGSRRDGSAPPSREHRPHEPPMRRPRVSVAFNVLST